MSNKTKIVFGTTAVLARSVERLTAVWEVAGSNPGAVSILQRCSLCTASGLDLPVTQMTTVPSPAGYAKILCPN